MALTKQAGSKIMYDLVFWRIKKARKIDFLSKSQ